MKHRLNPKSNWKEEKSNATHHQAEIQTSSTYARFSSSNFLFSKQTKFMMHLLLIFLVGIQSWAYYCWQYFFETWTKLPPKAWLNRWKMEGVDFSLENTTHLIGMTTKRSWQIKYSLFSPDHITLVRNWFHSALYFPPSHCPHAQPSRSQVSSTKGPVRINSRVMKASQLK